MIKNTFEELRLSGQLPSPSGVGMKILKLTQREDYCTDEIGDAIKADSALTGRILKIANSARSASIEPIATVNEATMRLGTQTVRNVALGLSLLSGNRSGTCESFDYDDYWSRSLARAVAGQALSQHTRKGSPAEAYILGLLSEIGKLALASVYPSEYSRIHDQGLHRDVQRLVVKEREQFHIDHAEVSALMLEEWGLPDSFQEAVKSYEQPVETRKLDDVTDVLRHAHVLARICCADEDDTTREEWLELDEGLQGLRACMDVDDAGFLAFCQGVVSVWREWGETLNIPTQPSVDFTNLAARAEQAGPCGRTEDTAELPEDEPLEEESTGHRDALRILVVDDDPMSQKLLQRVLVHRGFEVLTASNGEEALEQALRTSPSMVIADWMMPGMDGVELCRALRRIECGRQMYFLLLTGRDHEDRVVEAFEAGVDDYVVKPFNAKLLLARIKGGERVIGLQEQVARDKETMRRQVTELGRLTRKLRTAALTDALTDLPNRRYAMKRLEQEWAGADRSGRPLSVVMMDIDHFKSVNDTYGHDVGDVVLKSTAAAMISTTRESEDVCRLGGEEFCIICENSDAAGAATCAERIRAAVEANFIESGEFQRNVTISLGVAQKTDGMVDINDLLKAADEAVYAAKEGGRNQVCVHPNFQESRAKSA